MDTFHRKPYLTTIVLIMTVCAIMLIFLNVIAYAQGQPIQPTEPTALEQMLKIGSYVGLALGGLAVAVNQVRSIWRKYSFQESQETGDTYKKLADAKQAENIKLESDNAKLKAETIRLETVEKTLRQRLGKRKKLILRLIAKVEGDGTEFDEETEDV